MDYKSNVTIEMDGITYEVGAGEQVLIVPGCSITLRPFQYHLFWAKEGEGDLILGEVSSINDDLTDNYNAKDIFRFSKITEDEEILHPLCNVYEDLL